MPLSLFFTRSTKCYALINRYIIADFTSFSNDNTHAVVNEKSATNFRTGMNFNTCKKSTDLRNNSR